MLQLWLGMKLESTASEADALISRLSELSCKNDRKQDQAHQVNLSYTVESIHERTLI